MTVNRETRMAYFEAHYLSRQDVLFKLPLNIKIESFWAELLNQRKSKATILPLYDGVGKPYWFVLTDKMIESSERLCAEAMNQPDGFDPYRAPMTSAMSEEMIYTSYVEGAQISLKMAFDFLQRGAEPENIQEQMIWNNCQAWSLMMKALYKPLDETYVKSLAYILTDEMEGRAEGYRQTDGHAIAAMNDEPYSIPSAIVLPERMQDFYTYLRQPDVHPLIKASVGQAYLLVTRPFSEGNERLSRMLATAILLRSGYDYMRDISISGIISKDTYHYYKAMQEILRSENCGDLTYFVEYYLDVLSRSVNYKQEKDKRKALEQANNNEAEIERERKLAKQPLTIVEQMAESAADVIELPQTVEESILKAKQTRSSPVAILKQLITDGTEPEKRFASHFMKLIASNTSTFTMRDWEIESQWCRSVNQRDLLYGIKYGLLKRDFRTYTVSSEALTDDEIADAKQAIADGSCAIDPYCEMKLRLEGMAETGSKSEIIIAKLLLGMLRDGITSFNFSEWVSRAKLPYSTSGEHLKMATNYGLLSVNGKTYTICQHVDQEARFHVMTPSQQDILDRLYSYYSEKAFTIEEAAQKHSISHNTIKYTFTQLRQRGIIVGSVNGVQQLTFTFTKEYKQSIAAHSTTGEGHNPSSVSFPHSIAAARA